MAQMPADIAGEIKKSFKDLDAEFVAVRSSATAEDSASAAWAGQLDSYLNTTEAELLKNVQRCWASLFTSRAIFYRFEKELQLTKISVAVVVQKMVASEMSGIAFSVHPVTEDRNQLIIEAGWGLGEAIVSGQVTPDSYVVEKAPRKILDINVAVQARGLYRAVNGGNEWQDIAEPKASTQVLIGDQILELSSIVVKIEDHYGFPCDIEWAYEAGAFYVVQSRPITTLSGTSESAPPSIPKAKDYVLTYEGRGLRPLFYEIVSRGYLPPGSVATYKGDTARQFYSNSQVLKMHEMGKVFFSNKDSITEAMSGFEKLIKKSSTLAASLATGISEIQAQEVFQTLIGLHKAYAHFDFAYTDGAFEFSKTNASVEANLQEVEKKKNLFREEYNSEVFGEAGLLSVAVRELASRFKIPGDDLQWYLVNDLLSLFNGAPLSGEELGQRKLAYAFTTSNEGYTFLRGKRALEFIAQFGEISSAADGQDVVKGVTANKTGGPVVGEVFLLDLDYGDFEKLREQMANMKQGQVLVAATTAPEHMDAIRKASAIIADVGGMLSHTAIVSRELGIPSIVGTQFGSKVLKMGDMVEVDAGRGIVRKLHTIQLNQGLEV